MAAPLAPVEVIEKSRRGEEVDPESVESFVRAWLDGVAGDAQMSAWCMVACLRGLERGQIAALTRALIASGERLELGGLGATGDLHSTGGVGDSVLLAAAPLAAALGVRVATIAGRGQGHTGGSVDKLEAIPGYRADLPLGRFVRQVRDEGIAVISPTERLTPGDRRLHALRDATSTVSGAGLIAASAMAQKLAGGAQAIVIGVTAGDGGWFADAGAAREAAELMAWLAEPWGRPVRWAVTAMDQPLGRCVGNALEVREAGAVLAGEGSGDLGEAVVLAAADLAEAAGVVPEGEGAERARRALRDGDALAVAERWVEAQEGDPEVWTDPESLPRAPLVAAVEAPDDGYLAAVPARAAGEAARYLGAGRLHPDQSIDPATGIEFPRRVGERVARGEPLALIHARDSWACERAREMISGALALSAEPVAAPELVLSRGRGGAGAS